MVVLRYAPPQINIFHRRLYFYCSLFRCRAIGSFPPCPCGLGNVEFFPVLFVLGEFLRDEHRVHCDDENCCVGDQVVRLFGLGLSVFEFVDIFWYALAIKMIALHLVL